MKVPRKKLAYLSALAAVALGAVLLAWPVLATGTDDKVVPGVPLVASAPHAGSTAEGAETDQCHMDHGDTPMTHEAHAHGGGDGHAMHAANGPHREHGPSAGEPHAREMRAHGE